ncbi:hypothetical protein [Nocardiopsis prasina]|uniref:hypothetical protein n=1 Tax=Nocardiopsis prasina TaxID=2015 RepID=UPI001EF9CD39|nr:hypothetical protein [Nocardiopsis prasina]
MTGSAQVSTEVRSVLAAPRGHRFPRPAARPQRRSRSAPSWGVPVPSAAPQEPESLQARQERLLRQMQGNPRVAHMLEHGPVPHWVHVARQQRERAAREAREAQQAVSRVEPEPVLPRGRHRAPRRWWGWPATAISSTLLLGLTTLEALGRTLPHNLSIPS